MPDPEKNSYDGKIYGNLLFFGSSASEKTTIVQEMVSNSMFGKLGGVQWISAAKLSKEGQAETDSCFEPKVEFYNPRDWYCLKKTSADLENLYRGKLEKKKIDAGRGGNGKREYVERDNLITLDDVIRLAERSHSFVTFLSTCRKFGYCVFTRLH